ncbi:glycoside hydrolase family 97 C-terminal domain-containing protein [Paracidobacterium acidisoli]|uniref:glycoside hydrolase family 97 C-terminal domain-containing protein n=1 Tax=Paracidobacterium acidisoli TaxID=2303751 RepID=UPI002079F7D5|nr:glycoside hydrolase family 97 C-terminal domain-containing protein [Paracidobacterium acidisoli]
MTTDWTARSFDVPLGFLGSGSYLAQIYEDAKDAATEPTHVTIRSRTVTASQTLHIQLAPGGGCAIRFIPAKKR